LGEAALGIALSQALALVASVLVYGAAGWTSSDEVPLWAGALLQIPLWAGWMIAVVVAGRKGNGAVADFGIRFRPLDVPVGLAIGVAVQIVVLPLLYLPLLRLLGRSTDDLSAPARALTDKADGAAGWIVLALIVVVGAPVFEEIFYRGLLLGALRKRGLHDVVACLVSGAVFASMHFQGLQFAGLLLLGTLLSFMVVRTDRLGPAILAHAGFNATTVVVLYLAS
jgi:membrane protease YdiL (CAAX protease family)